MGLRDMYSAISGLQASSTWLDVIGNNISNVNTVAYKASRVEFSDQFSQTLYGGTGDNPSVGEGGVDPEQVGLGTRVASIQTLFTEGTLQNTGISTDIAIVGNGFLVSKSGDQSLLTRAGNLTFDSKGNLVDQNGGLIQGFTATTVFTQNTIDTAADAANVNLTPLVITSAKLTLQNTDPSAATDINIPATLTEPPLATTMVDFSGNLDAFQQATTAGGILNLGGNGQPPVLPIGMPLVNAGGAEGPNPAFGIINNPNPVAAPGTGQVLQQLGNPNEGPVGPADNAGIQGATNSQNWTDPIITAPVTLAAVQAEALAAPGTMAWDQQPPVTPAKQVVETVYDSNGNARQITVNFYQVNDLGVTPNINNPNGPNQVAYAWYAFDTTSGAPVNTTTLVGGTGILEGDTSSAVVGYDRGVTGDQFWGDLIVFNTDGSLLSTGGAEATAAGAVAQAMPDIYLPPENLVGAPPIDNGALAPASPLPTQGAEITQVQMNFGNAGVLGQGQRNGLYSDADGSYQIVNGVNTYVPNSTAYASSQNGYAEGQLQSLSFDGTGTINGTFSNGQVTALGQVILAEPNNPDGLASVGNNYYQTSPNSGPMFVGTAGQLDLGTVQGDTLELSNVDLTVELSNMIIAQRGFDVNSRVISVENSNLQILSQLGQGG
jgi:flagellar hook protein FlgE